LTPGTIFLNALASAVATLARGVTTMSRIAASVRTAPELCQARRDNLFRALGQQTFGTRNTRGVIDH
jgi:hypothetical protein